MFFIKSVYCRIFQTVFRMALPLLPYREPEIINSCTELGKVLKKEKATSVLVVTNKGIVDNGLLPFWQLVYHGYILSTPSTSSINYTLKDKDEELYMLECGGRPLMYYYSKFGEERNWMGNIDLRCGTEEEMKESIEAIRKASEFADKYKHLQYETMEKHEKLSDGVYQTTYSDETVVTVDYNTKSYTVKLGTK